MQIKLFGLEPESIVDGNGIRYVVFTQGCIHNCEGCHNLKSQSFDGGYFKDTNEVLSEIKEDPLLDGVTFSGGEPFCQPKELYELALGVKKLGLNVWCYSGYTIEELITMSKTTDDVKKLLSLIDVLIDGRFVLKEKSMLLRFRGSKNQRIIDVKKTLETNNVVELKYTDKII